MTSTPGAQSGHNCAPEEKLILTFHKWHNFLVIQDRTSKYVDVYNLILLREDTVHMSLSGLFYGRNNTGIFIRLLARILYVSFFLRFAFRWDIL